MEFRKFYLIYLIPPIISATLVIVWKKFGNTHISFSQYDIAFSASSIIAESINRYIIIALSILLLVIFISTISYCIYVVNKINLSICDLYLLSGIFIVATILLFIVEYISICDGNEKQYYYLGKNLFKNTLGITKIDGSLFDERLKCSESLIGLLDLITSQNNLLAISGALAIALTSCALLSKPKK